MIEGYIPYWTTPPILPFWWSVNRCWLADDSPKQPTSPCWIISRTMFSIFHIYIYYVYVYMYHLGFWTSCTVTVCNNHLKYSGSCSLNKMHPIHPIHPPRNFRHRMGHRYTDELQELLRQGQLRPVCEAGDPSDRTKVVGTKTSFYQQKGGEQIDKLGHLCSEMIWWYEMSHLDQRKCVVLPAKFGSQPRKSWVDMNQSGNWSTPNLDSTST